MAFGAAFNCFANELGSVSGSSFTRRLSNRTETSSESLNQSKCVNIDVTVA
jgi:hypothetical protein